MPCCVLCFESLAQGELWRCSFWVEHLLALQALFPLRLRLPFSRTSLGGFASWVFFFFFFPPFRWAGEEGGGSRGAPSVFYEVLPPLPLDFGPARGAGVPLGFCLSRAGSLLLLLLLREVGGEGVGSLAADALFPLLLVC